MKPLCKPIIEEPVPRRQNHYLSREDNRAVDILEKTTRLTDGNYKTRLLWQKDDVKLPNNCKEAEKRLQSLKRKFRKDPSLERKYRATMNDYIAEGHARKLMTEEASITGSRTWYLPHFTMTNCNKPNKVRIVFDAANEHKGTSLNKNLLPGPDYTNSLVGVLFRFRQEKVALVGDIKSMFHQVKVPPEDQDSLRFLWWSGSFDIYTYSPCSANFALLRTAEDNWKEFDPVTVDTLRENYDVDDPCQHQKVRLC